MDDKVYERIVNAGNKAKLDERTMDRYVKFCCKFHNEDGEMFYGGYASEWAIRFKNKSEYVYSDDIRTEYLIEIDKIDG